MNRLHKSAFCVLSAALAAICWAEPASAQDAVISHDPLFPGKGARTVSALTGVPYIGIVEYAYSVSDRVSLGLVAGLTPEAKAIGGRVRALVAQPSDSFRVYVKAPVFYYPPSVASHNEAWVLTWPTLNAEWRTSGDVRVWAGAGLVASSCLKSLFGIEDEEMETGGGFHGGMWNTLQTGVSRPIARNLAIHAEAAVVLKGFRTADDRHLTGRRSDLYWDTSTPVIVDLGFSYAF